MSMPSSPSPPDLSELDPSAATSSRSDRPSWVGRGVALALVLGLAAWIGVRVVSALGARRAIAEREAQAALSPAKAGRSAGAATARGEATTWEPVVPLEGTFTAIRETDLGFQVPGRLALAKGVLGFHVKQGEVLASLDSSQASAQVDAAAAQVHAAEAQLALADDAHHRTSDMADAGATAQATVVQTAQQRALASAQLDAARAQLALARATLAQHTLTAPFAGVLSRVPTGPGGIVTPGAVLYHLADWSSLMLVGTVSENDVAHVRFGAPVELAIGGRSVQGQVVAVLGTVDPATRRVPVEVLAKNDGAVPLLSGTFVGASIKGAAPVPVVKIPPTALRPGSQDVVMVVEAGRLRARHVTFASARDGAVLVRAGLAATDEFLVAPSPEAADGDAFAPAKDDP